MSIVPGGGVSTVFRILRAFKRKLMASKCLSYCQKPPICVLLGAGLRRVFTRLNLSYINWRWVSCTYWLKKMNWTNYQCSCVSKIRPLSFFRIKKEESKIVCHFRSCVYDRPLEVDTRTRNSRVHSSWVSGLRRALWASLSGRHSLFAA